jgi:hypothetical protein
MFWLPNFLLSIKKAMEVKDMNKKRAGYIVLFLLFIGISLYVVFAFLNLKEDGSQTVKKMEKEEVKDCELVISPQTGEWMTSDGSLPTEEAIKICEAPVDENVSFENKSDSEFLKYAEEKYGEEFELAVDVNTLGETDEKVFLHPKENKDMLFIVERVPEEYAEEFGNFNDHYIAAQMTHYLNEKYKEKMEEIVPSNAEYQFLVFGNPIKDDERIFSMPIEEYKKEVNDDIFLEMFVGIPTNGKPNVEEYSQMFHELFVLSESVGIDFKVKVGFMDEEKRKVMKEFVRTALVYDSYPWVYLGEGVYGELDVLGNVEYETPNDLLDYYTNVAD